MILPVTVPVTVACLTVTASGRRRGHDSSLAVTVTLLSFTVTLSDLRVSPSRPRLGSPGRPAPGSDRCSAAQRLSAGGLGRQGLATDMLGGGRPTARPPAVP